jgi:tetratricopeptide (TPR) repeat protein
MRLQSLLMNFTIALTLVAVPPLLHAQNPQLNNAAKALSDEGWNFLDDGKFTDAERKFREALNKYPRAKDADRTSYLLIKTLINQGRTQDAKTEILVFTRNYPQSPWQIDVDELRIPLGLPLHGPGQAQRYATPVSAPVPPPLPVLPVPPANIFRVPVAVNANLPMTPPVEQEVLRVMVLKDPGYAIAYARQRLKTNPSDPAVVTNFSTIALIGSPQAFPFFVTVANDGPSPNTQVQARYWIYRLSNEQDAVGKGFVEMVKEQAIPAVVEVLSRSNSNDLRRVLNQIVQNPSPEKVVGLEKVFKATTVQPFRSQIVETMATIPESAAREFLEDVAKNEEVYAVRISAIQGLGIRTDVPVRTLRELMPPPGRRGAQAPVKKE